MMELSQKRVFTFTWQIQNFNMCPQKFSEELKSPVFVVKMLHNSQWQIELYPKGSDTENIIACYLRCKSVGSSTKLIQIGFIFLVFSDDVTKQAIREVKNHCFKKADGWGFPILISRGAILLDKETYLPNNTFTIKCSIWNSEDTDIQQDFLTTECKSEDLAYVMKYNIKDSTLWDESRVITRVQVQRKNIFWPIRNFSAISFSEKLVICIPSILGIEPSLYMTFNKSIVHQSAEILIEKGSDFLEDTFVKCKISVLHTPRGVDISAEDEHLFEPDVEGIWKYPSFIDLKTLEEKKYFNRTCGVLHLRLEFSFSQLEGIHHTENAYMGLNETLLKNTYPIEEFGLVYKDGKLSDVTIEAGDHVFKVHKIILMARSPVFKAMFDNDVKEKATIVIDIPNVDPDTMDRMLAFMYTNAIEEHMLDEEVLELYSLADKYKVRSLKVRCAWILASSLSVSNVCNVLTLADQHNDTYLRDCAESFIHANPIAIFESHEWENFIQNSGTVAAKMMHKMLTN